MKTEENVKIKIEKLDDDLNGVAFRGGKKFVVKKTLPGEEVLCDVKRKSGTAIICDANEVVFKSDKRVTPPCKYFTKCGGCNLLHTTHKNQLEIKTALVKRKFSALGFFGVSDTVGQSFENSRNKTHLVFASKNGEIQAGFFNSDTHEVMDVQSCALHGKWYEILRRDLIDFVKSERVTIYNPRTLGGELRFAVARKIGCGLLLTLVVTREEKRDYEKLKKALEKDFAEVSIYINVNAEKTNAVFSDEFIHVAGKKTLSGEMLGVKFELSPNSFYQVNDEIAKIIYRKVLDEIKNSGATKVIDLFSGIGVTSVLFAKNGFDVDSVEIVKSAVDNAKTIIKENGVCDKVTAHLGDANKIIKTLDVKNSVVFVDPPRAGLRDVTRVLATAKPQKIIYLSCSLTTLVDDLKILKKAGYEISSVIPYDMFPSTKHVEVLTVLTCTKKN